jgi:hypothetical protein
MQIVQKSKMMLNAFLTAFGLNSDTSGLTMMQSIPYRSGTRMRKSRNKTKLHKGESNPTGTKLLKAIKHQKLGIMNPPGKKLGNVAEYYRQKKQDRMLEIQRKNSYGNYAGKLH